MEELDRARIAPMLAADADLQAGPRAASRDDALLDERADTVLVDRLERVVLQDADIQILREEVGCASSKSVRFGIIELSPFRDRSINDR